MDKECLGTQAVDTRDSIARAQLKRRKKTFSFLRLKCTHSEMHGTIFFDSTASKLITKQASFYRRHSVMSLPQYFPSKIVTQKRTNFISTLLWPCLLQVYHNVV